MLDWKNWCRLCGDDGTNEADIFLKDMETNCSIADDLKRLCNLKLESTSELPSKICKNCKFNIKNLKDFLIKCFKTQQMFTDFQCSQPNDCDTLRKRYKLTSNNDIKKEVDNFATTTSLVCKYESKEHELNDEKIKIIRKNSSDENLFASIENNLSSLNTVNEFPKTIEGKKCSSIANEHSSKNENITECIVSKLGSNCILAEDVKIVSENNLKISEKNKVKEKKNPNTFSCKICEKKFSSQGGLTIHMKVKHSIIKDPYTCKFCGKVFERLSRLERHENSHLPSEERKQLSCPHCDKKFNSDSGRWSHIYSVHDKGKAVICEECGKEFSTKHHLLKHKISHTQEKNLQCPSCPARFKGKVGLAAHMEIHGESFPCSICGVLLNTKQLLKKHMIVHSDAKNFKCNFCNKHFKRSKELNYHLITHIGIKPFECRICNRKFVHDMTYRRHIKSTHPTEFAEMVAKKERISSRKFPSPEQLKAINEAAKNTQ